MEPPRVTTDATMLIISEIKHELIRDCVGYTEQLGMPNSTEYLYGW